MYDQIESILNEALNKAMCVDNIQADSNTIADFVINFLVDKKLPEAPAPVIGKEIVEKKMKFIQITHNSQKIIQTVDDAKRFVDTINENEVYAFRVVFMSQEEFLKMPEFQGF